MLPTLFSRMPRLAVLVGWLCVLACICIIRLPALASLTAVIGSGQDELLGAMLGSGEELPGSCRFLSGAAHPQTIVATYTCAGQSLVLELRHRGAVPMGAPHSDHFALAIKEGLAPSGLIEALLARIREREAEFQWQWLGEESNVEKLLRIAVVVLPAVTITLATVLFALAMRRLYRGEPGLLPIAWGTMAWVRVAGLLVVGLAVVCGGYAETFALWWVRAAMFLLVAFGWLVATGFFETKTRLREHWPGLVLFLIALLLREGLARHSVEGVEIGFVTDPVGRHSVVYPLLQAFFVPWVPDAHAFTMHMNGTLGAFGCWSAYRFLAWHLGGRAQAVACTLPLALHPLIARFAPTDGPYSLIFASWFTGLALLSVPRPTSRSLFGGIVLLGIAASCRIEGTFYLVASLFLLPMRTVLDGVQRHRAFAALAGLVVAVLLAVQMHTLLPGYASGRLGTDDPQAVLLPRARLFLQDALWPIASSDPLLTGLLWLGVFGGLVTKQRFGALAYLATCVVLFPVVGSGQSAHALHRMLPACAMQTLVTGMGAVFAGSWIATRTRRPWLMLVPSLMVCATVLVRQYPILTTPYVFAEEYDLVRSHLAGPQFQKPPTDCVLGAFNTHPAGDIDLHDFHQVVPHLQVLDCRRSNCAAAATTLPCMFYVRSVACYFQDAGVEPACAAQAKAPSCLCSECAAFEQTVVLKEVETRIVDILATFPDRVGEYPRYASIGLYHVVSSTAD